MISPDAVFVDVPRYERTKWCYAGRQQLMHGGLINIEGHTVMCGSIRL